MSKTRVLWRRNKDEAWKRTQPCPKTGAFEWQVLRSISNMGSGAASGQEVALIRVGRGFVGRGEQ